MSKSELNIITSPSAKRMLRTVTEGFYDRSRIGLWMFEVIGREYDDMAKWSEELKYEAFPQTATWSISIWEFIYGFEPDDTLPLDFRRGRILSKRLQHPPINPARIEAILSALVGVPVEVIENVAPYTFRVIVDETEIPAVNLNQMFRLLRQIKPSHLAIWFDHRMYVLFINSNRFIFTKFEAGFRIMNRTAPGILLDGKRRLDGTWLLNAFQKSFFLNMFEVKSRFSVNSMPGMNVQVFKVSAINFINVNTISFSVEISQTVSVTNENKFTNTALDISGNTMQNDNDLTMQRLGMGVFEAQNENGISGTLTRSEFIPLDGTQILDGSWNIGKNLTTEDL